MSHLDSVPAHLAKFDQGWMPPTAVNLLAKVNDHQTRQTLTLLTWKLRLNTARHFIRSQSWTEKVLQLIWDHLPQDSINKAIRLFTKTRRAFVKGGMDI